MKKVLIVEDKLVEQLLLKRELDGEIEIITAFSIEEAETKFAANPDVAAIVMDACVPGHDPNTGPLVKRLRALFAGPIIATSSVLSYRQQLVQAGCDFECGKDSVPHKLREALDL